MKRLLVAVVLGWSCSLAFAQSGARFDELPVSERYVIKDSGFPALRGVMGLPLWLDDRRLMFEGVDLEATMQHPTRQIQSKPYIWDTETGMVTKYRDHRIFQVCYSDGVIHYKVEDEKTKEWAMYKGPLGSEQEQKQWLGKSRNWNPYDCSVLETGEPMASLRRSGRNIFILRLEHGYVDVGPTNFRLRSDTPEFDYRRYSMDGKLATTLGISRLSTAWPVQWMPFSNRYLFDESWPSHQNRVWLVSPEGVAQSITLPQRDWNYPRKVIGVKKGVLMTVTGSSTTTPYKPGSQGLYMVSDAGFERLIRGIAIAIAVSPNGCKVSLIHPPYTMAEPEGIAAQRQGRVANTMQFIDVCRVK